MAARVVTLPGFVPPASPAASRAPTHPGPPSPGDGLAWSEARLPSGDPLSTRTWAEEGPWAELGWGGLAYPAELLGDSDLTR